LLVDYAGDVAIVGNTSEYNGDDGIDLGSCTGANLFVIGNTVFHNDDVGIKAVGMNENLQIQGNHVEKNAVDIWVDCARDAVLQNNTVVGWPWSTGARVRLCSRPIFVSRAVIAHNSFWSTDTALEIRNCGVDCLVSRNVICGNETGAIAAGENADRPAAISDNYVAGNARGVIGTDVDARANWWGDASGPSGFGPGHGDSIEGTVAYDPWLTIPEVSAGAPGYPFTAVCPAISVP
jgi:hypothetical protein